MTDYSTGSCVRLLASYLNYVVWVCMRIVSIEMANDILNRATTTDDNTL